MWTGLFTLQYKDFLINLKGKVPASALARIDPNALKWTANGFNAANGPYVIPLENQFYIGFYNKAAFTKAGVSAVPTDWSQLFAACKKLQAAGLHAAGLRQRRPAAGRRVLPLVRHELHDDRLVLGVRSGRSLYSGQIPWTAPPITRPAHARGPSCKSSGCTNSDVLTNTNNLGQFETGKAAMMVDGTWDTQKFTKRAGQQGRRVRAAVLEQPRSRAWSTSPGDGLSMMSYAKHPRAAAEFLTS